MNLNFLVPVSLLLLMSSCKNVESSKMENQAVVTDSTMTTASADRFAFSLAQWSLHKPFLDGSLDPMEFPQIAKDLGFSGVEYVTQLYPSVREEGDDYRERVMTLAEALKEKAEAADIENVLLMVDRAGELADPDPEKRATAIDNHKIWMDAAAVMGAHSVRANLFGETDPEKWHDISVASLRELGNYGNEVGVNIIIENHGGWSSDGEKMQAVMNAVGMERVGTLPDFGNFCIERQGGERWGAPCIKEYDMYEGIAQLMPYAEGVSAKSYAFNEAGMETKIDYPRMLQIVADSGFEGFIGVEYEGDLEDPKEGIALTKALVEESIKRVKDE